ncbi:fructose-6-phosphate aldolase [Pedobacter sp.]
MYIIKVKGIAKIPDYVQLRDDKFTLLAYFRVDRPDKSLEKLGFGDHQEKIMNIINDLPFGQVTKLEL